SQFLGVPYEHAVAEFFRSRRINSSFHKGPSAAPALHELTDPWPQWTAEQRKMFVEEAGPALVKYGLGGSADLTGDTDGSEHPLGGRIRRVLRCALPEGIVAVVSKGDQDLVDSCGPLACHFPQDDGQYAGYHPADSQAAIEHLETLRTKDVRFLLFP